jgi:short-subunit dehydrogenase
MTRQNKHLRKREEGRQRILAERPLRALVTGASAGIGRAFCELLAEERHDLILVARRKDALEQAAIEIEARHGVRCTVIPADLADPNAVRELVAQVEGLGLEVDVLVNNAGYTMDGHYLSYSWEEHEAYQRVMAIAPAELSYRFLPGMVRRGFGQILNVASAAALMPATPFNALYGPCKHHMTILTRTLQGEFGPAGISVSVSFPPPVADTGIVNNTKHGQAWTRFTFLLATTEQCARTAYDAVQAGRMTAGIGPVCKVLAVQNKLLPANLNAKLGGATVAFLSKEKPIDGPAAAGLPTN